MLRAPCSPARFAPSNRDAQKPIFLRVPRSPTHPSEEMHDDEGRHRGQALAPMWIPRTWADLERAIGVQIESDRGLEAMEHGAGESGPGRVQPQP